MRIRQRIPTSIPDILRKQMSVWRDGDICIVSFRQEAELVFQRLPSGDIELLDFDRGGETPRQLGTLFGRMYQRAEEEFAKPFARVFPAPTQAKDQQECGILMLLTTWNVTPEFTESTSV